jgi:hypothetical protein
MRREPDIGWTIEILARLGDQQNYQTQLLESLVARNRFGGVVARRALNAVLFKHGLASEAPGFDPERFETDIILWAKAQAKQP